MADKVEPHAKEEKVAVESKDAYAELVDKENQLNIKCLHCKRCGSKIVKEFVATFIEDRKV